MSNIIAIIPARSGSKSLEDKNIKMLAGHPLIAYSIVAAQMSEKIERVIVSTNSEQYRNIAKRYGAEVPFLRPEKYSNDNSSDREFFIHAMEWLKKNEKTLPEYWVHLRPTTPLRSPKNIDTAINMILKDNNATSLRSGHKAPESPLKWFIKKNSYFKGLIENEQYNLPKESFEEVFIPDGYIDIVKASYLLNNNQTHGENIIAFESPVCTEIDSLEEFKYIQYQIKNSKNLLLDELNKVIGN